MVATGTWGWFHFGDESALTQTSKALLDALKAGDAGGTTAILASSETGSRLLNKELTRTSARSKETTKAEPHAMVPALSEVRASLAKDGVDWNGAQPLAFGGVRAQVMDPATMQAFATVVTGELYFASGAGVFAVEFSARKCGSVFVITDIWQYHSIKATKDQLAEYSSKRFREFMDEPEDPKETARLRSPKHLFVVF